MMTPNFIAVSSKWGFPESLTRRKRRPYCREALHGRRFREGEKSQYGSSPGGGGRGGNGTASCGRGAVEGPAPAGRTLRKKILSPVAPASPRTVFNCRHWSSESTLRKS